MRTTKIIIKNLFGITECELDGRSVEITGTNGTGKTSVIDAIRLALTNSSNRDYVIRKGETEGEILIETDTGLRIDRKKRSQQADYKSVKESGREVSAPEAFLSQFFTELQLDPVAFTRMNRQEQNRAILDLIQFDWDLGWIKEKFGEIPSGVSYDQNILQVLNDIQSEKGEYFQRRQELNRDIRNKRAFIEDIAKDIPAHYQANVWEAYPLGEKYREMERIRENNSVIERARGFREAYNNKLRGLEATRDIDKAAEEKTIAAERSSLKSTIERLKAEIVAAQDKLGTLDGKLSDRIALIDAKFAEGVAKLNADNEVANKYANDEPTDTTKLNAEITEAESMKAHLNEYKRMVSMQSELDELTEDSAELTRKIELARELPGEILRTATLPVDGLTVENGIPHINGLPISNLSEGEQLDLCVDVTISKPQALQIILIDGAEKLSDVNRARLYAKCKDKGLQFIATRTTNDETLEVTTL